MRRLAIAVLVGAGCVALAYPLVWLTFGGYAVFPTDVPPLGLRNPDLPFIDRSDAYIPLAGWFVLGVAFVLGLVVPPVTRRLGFAPGGALARRVRAPLLGLGAITLLVAGSYAVEPLTPWWGWRPEEPSIDGWPLGPVIDCEPLEEEARLVSLARSRLSDDEQASVVEITCHREGRYLDRPLTVVAMSGGGRGIGMAAPIVFTFADGTRRAIGVGCGLWATESGTGRRVHSGCGPATPIDPGR